MDVGYREAFSSSESRVLNWAGLGALVLVWRGLFPVGEFWEFDGVVHFAEKRAFAGGRGALRAGFGSCLCLLLSLVKLLWGFGVFSGK